MQENFNNIFNLNSMLYGHFLLVLENIWLSYNYYLGWDNSFFSMGKATMVYRRAQS